MFRFLQRKQRDVTISHLHDEIVAAARHPALYGEIGFPDGVDGRFEALTLHVLLVLSRLRELPEPAAEVAQELVDSVFAHIEAGMRETGVGDMGVPKKMKKLGRAFYDRTAKYEAALEGRDAAALAAELARRLGREGGTEELAAYLLDSRVALSGQDLARILERPSFADAGRIVGAGGDIS